MDGQKRMAIEHALLVIESSILNSLEKATGADGQDPLSENTRRWVKGVAADILRGMTDAGYTLLLNPGDDDG